MTDIKQVYVIGDKQFDTKAEALSFTRRPKQFAAFQAINDGNEKLSNWLIDHQDEVESSFETGTIRRVSKSDRAKLEKALDAVVAAGNKDFAFLVENREAVADSFRWPSVKRLNDVEKAAAIMASLMLLTENDEDLSRWIIANEAAILAAYEAGVEKRAISPKAQDGLARYQAQVALDKAAAEAEGIPYAEFKARKKAQQDAEAAAKAAAEATA